MNVYENIKKLNILIPSASLPGGKYTPVKQTGNLLYVSGQVCIEDGKPIVGKAGIDLSLEEAQAAAKICMLNTLAALEKYLGDLNKIKSVVKIAGFVACADDFKDQANVLNAASQLLIDIFGEAGIHARSAVGTNSLPLNYTVEIESIFEV